MSPETVSYELRDGVAVVRIDDGKVNAISPGVITSMNQVLEQAEKDVAAVLLTGRPGTLSAGFDLTVMRQGADQARELVRAGGELALRLFGFPRPVIIASPGHAIAMGAILLLTADRRVGADGAFRIGLNEVAIGMRLPVFGVELARHRLSKRHLTRAALTAEPYDPKRALDAGFLDRVVPAEKLEDEAFEEARRLAAFSTGAYRGTKMSLRQATLTTIRDTLEEDMSRIAAPVR